MHLSGGRARPVIGLLMLTVIGLPLTIKAGQTCHIHPPQDPQENPQPGDDKPMVIGPFDSLANCEQGNRVLYGGQGRCHCSFSSLPQGQQGRPFDVPAGGIPPSPLP